MFNEALISLTGYVATQPRWHDNLPSGLRKLSMRVAWTPRHLDRTSGEWKDGNTSFLTVYCWRQLADNVGKCLHKGDPVLVKGRLTVRDWKDRTEQPRTSVEVDAISIGHDLTRGVAQFLRTRASTGLTADELRAEQGTGPEPGAAAGSDGSPAIGQAAASADEPEAVLDEPGLDDSEVEPVTEADEPVTEADEPVAAPF